VQGILISEVSGTGTLVTRQAARTLYASMEGQLPQKGTEVQFDFSNLQALTPSFLDELITILGERFRKYHAVQPQVMLANLPERLSVPLVTIGRAHRLEVVQKPPGTWRLQWPQ
jgi:STAS-like domain of unknown function (DUF4325)